MGKGKNVSWFCCWSHNRVSQRKPKAGKMCGFKLCITILTFI